jgi:hypothetical protein
MQRAEPDDKLWYASHHPDPLIPPPAGKRLPVEYSRNKAGQRRSGLRSRYNGGAPEPVVRLRRQSYRPGRAASSAYLTMVPARSNGATRMPMVQLPHAPACCRRAKFFRRRELWQNQSGSTHLSSAAVRAASCSRGEYGRRTAVVERCYVCGSCPNIACMPSKEARRAPCSARSGVRHCGR